MFVSNRSISIGRSDEEMNSFRRTSTFSSISRPIEWTFFHVPNTCWTWSRNDVHRRRRISFLFCARSTERRFSSIYFQFVMRSNRFLFLLCLSLYLIGGFSLLITGSVAHSHAKHFAKISGSSLVSGADFIISLGVFVLILSSLGFYGTYKNRSSFLKIFIGFLSIILLLQLIAAIVAFSLHDKAEDQLRTRLIQSLTKYKEDSIGRQWDFLQRSWSCCGVDQPSDWQKLAQQEDLPKSCCVQPDCLSTVNNGTAYFETGCYQSVLNIFFRYSKALGGVTIFFFLVELVGLILAIFVIRDSSNSYGTV